MFKNKVQARYQIISYEEELDKMIEEAEEELEEIQQELKKLREEYEKLVAIEKTPMEKLEQLEDKIDKLEKKEKDAEKKLDNIRHTSIEDLKADKRYEDWKGSR